MSTKDFPADVLEELTFESVGSGLDGRTLIADEFIEARRWATRHRLVFRDDDGYWATFYEKGATENQEDHPMFDYQDPVRCVAVYPTEKVTIVYREAK